MKKFAGFAVLLFALVIMGAVSASAAKTIETKALHSGIVADVVSRSGDTVRLSYSGPEGNKAFCVGDKIPVFKKTGFAMQHQRLSGEVKITKLVGKNEADGKLIVGNASRGYVATKPSAQCLKKG